MILEAAVMGGATSAGLYFIYKQLPERVKDWMADHPLIFDAAFTYVTWVIHYGTATGVLAAAFAGILGHCLMYVRKHPADYEWVQELYDSVKVSATVVLDWIRDGLRAFAAMLKGGVDRVESDIRARQQLAA